MRIMRVRGDLERQPLLDSYAFRLNPGDLFRVVGEQPDALHTEQFEHSPRDRKIARINSETEADIGVDMSKP